MRNHFNILLFLLTINCYAFSQADFYAMSQEGVRAKIDSLKKILPALKDAEQIDCLSELSDSYLAFSIDTAKVYADQVLAESERIGYRKGKAKAYKNLGRVSFLSSTDLPAAEKYFGMSLELFIIKGNEQEIAWAWAALGCSKWVLGKFTEAMSAFEKAEQLFKKIGDTANLVGTYDNMFSTEFQSGNYARSLEYIFKREDLTGEEDYFNLAFLYDELGDIEMAEQYRSKIPLDNMGAYKYMVIAEGFYRKNLFDSAFYYYDLYSGHVNPEDAGSCSGLYFGVGKSHFALKHYDTALVYLNRSLNMSETAGDQNQVMRVLLVLAKTYKEKGDYVSAIKNGQHLLRMASETGARQFNRDAHLLLYQLFEDLHNKDSSYLHLKKYTAINDSIDLDLSAQKMAFYKIKSEREKAKADISILNEEKKLHQEQLQKEALIKKFLAAGLIVLIVMGIIFFRNIALKHKNERLESERAKSEFKQQATELEMQALRAQMNPHFIFNCLNAINRYILVNESENAADYLTKFSRLVRLILQNSQVAFISLESELEALKLYLDLEALRFEHRFDYKIWVQKDIDIEILKIPPLVIQPYAENAIRHGLMHKEDKGNLNIAIEQNNGHLIFRITDNGIGRKAAEERAGKLGAKHKSMGLKITAERIAILQSSNGVESPVTINDLAKADGSAAGTEVVINIPVVEEI